MPVFFVSSQNIINKNVFIEGSLFEHLTKSLRVREGDELVVGDDTRQRHHIRVCKLKKAVLEGEILRTEHGPPPAQAKVVLGQAMLKGDHMNWAIQKAIELGVSTIVPLLTDRVIVRPRPDRFQSLQERYSRIALDAAQQSEQWDIPQVLPPQPIHDFFETYRQETTKCMLVEREDLPRLKELELQETSTGLVVLAIGPEGGWTVEEKEKAQDYQFKLYSLGAAILRGETAPLAALSIIQFRLGNLG